MMTSPDSTGTVPVTALTGLSAFPLTPLKDGQLDQTAFIGLVQRLVAAGVDSITVLGSTGSYMYLDRAERERVIRLAVQHAAGIPVLAGVGAMRTEHHRATAASERGGSVKRSPPRSVGGIDIGTE